MSNIKVLVVSLVGMIALAGDATAAPTGAGLKTTGVQLPIINIQRALGCVAVGLRRNGRRIRGVRGSSNAVFRRTACHRAMRRCVSDLRARQRRGLSPRGRCVIRNRQ